jgi:hypothetical protein
MSINLPPCILAEKRRREIARIIKATTPKKKRGVLARLFWGSGRAL